MNEIMKLNWYIIKVRSIIDTIKVIEFKNELDGTLNTIYFDSRTSTMRWIPSFNNEAVNIMGDNFSDLLIHLIINYKNHQFDYEGIVIDELVHMMVYLDIGEILYLVIQYSDSGKLLGYKLEIRESEEPLFRILRSISKKVNVFNHALLNYSMSVYHNVNNINEENK